MNCSFCNTPSSAPAVKKIVKSEVNPKICICDSCIKLAKSLLADAFKPKTAKKGT